MVRNAEECIKMIKAMQDNDSNISNRAGLNRLVF